MQPIEPIQPSNILTDEQIEQLFCKCFCNNNNNNNKISNPFILKCKIFETKTFEFSYSLHSPALMNKNRIEIYVYNNKNNNKNKTKTLCDYFYTTYYYEYYHENRPKIRQSEQEILYKAIILSLMICLFKVKLTEKQTFNITEKIQFYLNTVYTSTFNTSPPLKQKQLQTYLKNIPFYLHLLFFKSRKFLDPSDEIRLEPTLDLNTYIHYIKERQEINHCLHYYYFNMPNEIIDTIDTFL